MKTLFYIISLLLLPLVGLGQESNLEEPLKKEKTTFNNQVDFDIELLGGELALKKRIKGKLFLGVSAGVGLFISLSSNGRMASFYKFKGFLDYDIDNRVHFYLGYQYFPEVFILEIDNGGPYSGAVVGIFDKGRKIEYGVEVTLGEVKEHSFVGATTLLIIKIPMVRW